jgi:hypothetical protein
MNQFLSQDEVDALLRGISEGEVETEQDTGLGGTAVPVYDLANQERIIRGRMPTLEIISQKLARQLRAALSGALRRVVDVNALPVDTMKFGESQVQGVVAAYAEFLHNPHSIKGVWVLGSLLTQQLRLSRAFQMSHTRAMISVMRDVFVQKTTFASLSARYQREKSSLFASTP